MIRSTIPAVYALRSMISAIIEIAITDWRYDTVNEQYVATVEDYAVIQDENQVETKQLCNTKQVYYSNLEIDGLFSLLGNPILTNESYSSELKKLISSALLHVTKTDLYDNGKTIYGLQPEEWELKIN